MNRMDFFQPDGVHSQLFQSAQVCLQSSDAHKGFIKVVGETCGAKQRWIIRADDHWMAL